MQQNVNRLDYFCPKKSIKNAYIRYPEVYKIFSNPPAPATILPKTGSVQSRPLQCFSDG
jgi:hypothetical protein